MLARNSALQKISEQLYNRMRYLIVFACFSVTNLFAQSHTSLDTLIPKGAYENISMQSLNSDSNVTSLVIWIKEEVKPHVHAAHSEHAYILQGSGRMLLDGKTIDVKAGDLIFMPQGIVHAVKVTSSVPMKVLSIQAPAFDGKDRIPVDVQW